MKLLPYGCEGTRALGFGNYCVAWWLYHGIPFAIGCALVAAAYLTNSDTLMTVGKVACLSSSIAGVINWAIDRQFSL